MKHKLNKKANFLLILLGSISIITLMVWYGKFNNEDNNTISNPINNNNNNNVLQGEIVLMNDESFSLMTNNDVIYQFPTINNVNFKLGDYLEITYTSNLSLFHELQNIEILNTKKITSLNFNKNDLFYAYYEKANKLIESMSLKEKIGQFLLARVPAKNKITTINEYAIGGYLFFGRDIKGKTKDDLINEINSYQENTKISLLTAIDEEGGIVSRLSTNPNILPTPFLSSQELYKTNGFTSIKEDTVQKSQILKELGFNVNLAPVIDVTTNKKAYMYKRSFGQNAMLTSLYAQTVIENTAKDVSFILKHFPGYGDNVDTHQGVAIDNRSYNSFVQNDFKPFQKAIETGAPGILVSHNIIKAIDPNNPASLSRNIHNILRNELNFTGVIITDDLDMKAIQNYVSSPYVEAILSGNNILIVTDINKAYNDINEAINKNIISEQLLDRLLVKTLAWKYDKGLIIK